MDRHDQIIEHYKNLYGGVDITRPKSWIINVKKMKRKTCSQSKKDNPNWGKKLQTECSLRKTFNITECFSDSPRVVMFSDDLIINQNGLNMAYSCTGLNK